MIKIEAAAAWLTAFMNEKSQGGRYAVSAKSILDGARAAGFSSDVTRRAYHKLGGAKPKKNGMAGWCWRLQSSNLQSSKATDPLTVGNTMPSSALEDCI